MHRRYSQVKPTALEWKNITISSTNGNKQIIKNANGVVQPGQMLAIMGSSGAGKTTLLNSLANRSIGANITRSGQILINDQKIDGKSNHYYKSISAYCQQQDLFIGSMTPREHLIFHARLKNVKKAKNRVAKVIQEMNLEKCADTKIGTVGRDKTLSGGEKKRLSFGTNILIQPSILFADEPTSGLDTNLAKSVVKSLRTIADDHNTCILCTIHQPNSETFEMFDKVLLLSNGYTVYFGESRKFVKDYFSATLDLDCPLGFNLADFLISVISVDEGKAKEFSRKFDVFQRSKEKNATSNKMQTIFTNKPNLLSINYRSKTNQKFDTTPSSDSTSPPSYSKVSKFLESNSFDDYPESTSHSDKTSNHSNFAIDSSDSEFKIQPMTSEAVVLPNQLTHEIQISSESDTQCSYFTQLKLLTWRALIQNYRDRALIFSRLFQTMAIALVLSGIYFRSPSQIPNYVGPIRSNFSGNDVYSESEDIKQINGAIFSTTAVASFNFLFYVILIFPIMTPIWRMEYEDELYSFPIAFLANNLAEIPIYLFIPLLYTSIVYWLMGFYPSYHEFFKAYGLFTLVSNTAGSFGYFGSALSENPQIVAELVPALMLPMICFGGFVTPLDSIPGVIQWLRYLSWFPYSTEAFANIQWTKVEFYCKINEIKYNYTTCPPDLKLTGEQFVENNLGFEISDKAFTKDIFVMLGQLFIYRFISMLILWARFYFTTTGRGKDFFEKTKIAMTNLFSSAKNRKSGRENKYADGPVSDKKCLNDNEGVKLPSGKNSQVQDLEDIHGIIYKTVQDQKGSLEITNVKLKSFKLK